MPVPGKMLLPHPDCSQRGKRQDYITERFKLKLTMDPDKKKPRVNRDRLAIPLRLTVQLLFDANHPLAQVRLAFNVTGDLIYGVHHGRMITATKHCADLRQRGICLFSQ